MPEIKEYNVVQNIISKMLQYKFRDKERERSNHASNISDRAQGTKRRCPMQHNKIAWSGPPHDEIQAYICIICGACASEPEIKDRGLDFDTVLYEVILEIMDLDLERQSNGHIKTFA